MSVINSKSALEINTVIMVNGEVKMLPKIPDTFVNYRVLGTVVRLADIKDMVKQNCRFIYLCS